MIRLEIFLIGLLTQLRQIGPWWLAGLLAGSAVSVFLSDKILSRVVTLKSGRFSLWATGAAALLGIASPVCMYGTIPLLAALGRKNVPHHLLAAFMVSSILLNPNLLIVSFALGAPLAIGRLLASLAAGVLAGVLIYVFHRGSPLFRFEHFELPSQHKRTYWRDVLRSLRVTAPYFAAGIVLTALFDAYVPKTWIAALFGDNRGLGILLAVSLSVPLYVCGGGTVPLLAAWLAAGMSPGSAMAFMIAGPATKFTNLGAVKILLGWRSFLLYLGFILAIAVLMGFLAGSGTS